MSGRVDVTRRQLLGGIGALAVAGGVGAYTLTRGGWQVVETPVDEDLNGLARSSAGTVAVGDNGTLLVRTGDGWTQRVDDGPGGDGRNLNAADATDDGSVVWAVGASGAIGAYDTKSESFADHSAPGDTTNNFQSVAVRGQAGSASVYVSDSAGKIHVSTENGASGTWSSVTPGSGAAIPAVDFHSATAGHAVDTDGSVWATSDGASTWDRIGVEDANVNFYGVDSDGPSDVTVSGGNATLLDYGDDWDRTDLGDASLTDLEVTADGGMTVGDGGVGFVRRDGSWKAANLPTGANLAAVSLGAPTIVVGASGTVLEK